mmetsp:Transcript_26245/g.84741  ORF Transcript_26245/g.84741 Transcript_26245/m.84741 type:complete len:327 (-) Transcript_26245:22-1002(-)
MGSVGAREPDRLAWSDGALSVEHIQVRRAVSRTLGCRAVLALEWVGDDHVCVGQGHAVLAKRVHVERRRWPRHLLHARPVEVVQEDAPTTVDLVGRVDGHNLVVHREVGSKVEDSGGRRDGDHVLALLVVDVDCALDALATAAFGSHSKMPRRHGHPVIRRAKVIDFGVGVDQHNGLWTAAAHARARVATAGEEARARPARPVWAARGPHAAVGGRDGRRRRGDTRREVGCARGAALIQARRAEVVRRISRHGSNCGPLGRPLGMVGLLGLRRRKLGPLLRLPPRVDGALRGYGSDEVFRLDAALLRNVASRRRWSRGQHVGRPCR